MAWRLKSLTTPIAYMITVPTVDPFICANSGFISRAQDHPPYEGGYNYGDAWTSYNTIKENPLNSSWRCRDWRIESAGPDMQQQAASVPSYNSSNGLVSNGDIQRLGPPAHYPGDASPVGK